MPQVTLTVNGTPYQFACRDGEEPRLKELAAVIDAQTAELAKSMGRIGDAKLMLMASLLLLDEAGDERNAIRVSGDDMSAHVKTVDQLAVEIENIAAQLESA